MSITNLKFLVDVGVGKKVEEFLYNLNYDTRTIREINPRMTDDKIIDIAAKENRMCC
jgi:predicted nuclease of predicted toxin-antitoxin system